MLSEKVKLGENMGLSVEKFANTTELVADYPAEHEVTRSQEVKMLMVLLNSGSNEEQHTLAHMLLEMVEKTYN